MRGQTKATSFPPLKDQALRPLVARSRNATFRDIAGGADDDGTRPIRFHAGQGLVELGVIGPRSQGLPRDALAHANASPLGRA